MSRYAFSFAALTVMYLIELFGLLGTAKVTAMIPLVGLLVLFGLHEDRK